jgi:prefoldin subunit 5
LAQVQPDPEIERVESLQNALDDLEKAENRYNDALANVTSEAQFESLSFYKDIIEQLKANVQSLMKQAIANRLKGET